MSSDLRLDEVLERIDVYGRLAFGGQCVAAMALVGAPIFFVTVSILPFFLWGDNRAEALTVWLGGWALAAGAGVAAAAFGVFCWRWSGDWITEWPGYAVAFCIALVANGVLAYMLTSTPVPVYLSFAVTMMAAFAAGFLVAGHLAGTHVLTDTRHQRQGALARRR